LSGRLDLNQRPGLFKREQNIYDQFKKDQA
jgi:hypothetical protein